MCYENNTSRLAPGGAASSADGVRQQRYSGSREESCGKDLSCAPNAMNNTAFLESSRLIYFFRRMLFVRVMT